MVRISDMNMYLHGCTSPNIIEYDTLTFDEKWEDKYDVVLANPPFMTPKGGITPHNRFSIKSKKSEVLFAEYIMDHMTRNGKASYIVPEGIIANNSTAYIDLRTKMIENGLFAVIGLHQYVFKPYSGVSTMILFFDKKYKNREDIYLRMIEDDGYEKGEGRSPTPEINELPICKYEIELFQQHLNGVLDINNFSISGKVINKNDLDSKLDFHPYSYYETDVEPLKIINEIFNVEKGSLQSSKNEEGDYDFITASDTWLTHNEFTHDTEALIFVFAAGGSLGKVHYVNGKFIASDLCYVLTPKDSNTTNLKYYYAYFNSHRKSIVKRLARGTNKKSINEPRFLSYLIPFPNKPEQDQVGQEVENSFLTITSLKKQISLEYRNIESLFQI